MCSPQHHLHLHWCTTIIISSLRCWQLCRIRCGSRYAAGKHMAPRLHPLPLWTSLHERTENSIDSTFCLQFCCWNIALVFQMSVASRSFARLASSRARKGIACTIVAREEMKDAMFKELQIKHGSGFPSKEIEEDRRSSKWIALECNFALEGNEEEDTRVYFNSSWIFNCSFQPTIPIVQQHEPHAVRQVAANVFHLHNRFTLFTNCTAYCSLCLSQWMFRMTRAEGNLWYEKPARWLSRYLILYYVKYFSGIKKKKIKNIQVKHTFKKKYIILRYVFIPHYGT